MHNIEMAALVAENNLLKAKNCDNPELKSKLLRNVLGDLVYISKEIKNWRKTK